MNAAVRIALFWCSVELLANPALSDVSVYEENDVLVLTKSNFDHVISNNEHVLVDFYAPWCGHCVKLEPEYAAAAMQLRSEGSRIRLAKVDATVETELAAKYEARGFPTIKFFRQGKPYTYNGYRDQSAMVSWLRSRTTPPKDLATPNDVKNFQKTADMVVVGFFRDTSSDRAKILHDVAFLAEDIPFGITSADEAFDKYKVTDDTIVVFKKFDEKRNDYDGPYNVEDVKFFVQANSRPLIAEFAQENAEKLFGGEIRTHHILFVSKKTEDYEKVLAEFRSAAEAFKGMLSFVYINSDMDENIRLLDFFELKREDMPAVRMINIEEDITKFKPDFKDLTKENLIKFTQDYLDKKLTTMDSAEEPSEPTPPAKDSEKDMKQSKREPEQAKPEDDGESSRQKNDSKKSDHIEL